MVRINRHPYRKLHIHKDRRQNGDGPHDLGLEDFRLTDDYPRNCDRHRQPRVTAYDPSIDFEPDQEQKQSKSNVRDQREIGYRLAWEYVFCEPRNPTERGGPEQNAA